MIQFSSSLVAETKHNIGLEITVHNIYYSVYCVRDITSGRRFKRG